MQTRKTAAAKGSACQQRGMCHFLPLFCRKARLLPLQALLFSLLAGDVIEISSSAPYLALSSHHPFFDLLISCVLVNSGYLGHTIASMVILEQGASLICGPHAKSIAPTFTGLQVER